MGDQEGSEFKRLKSLSPRTESGYPADWRHKILYLATTFCQLFDISLFHLFFFFKEWFDLKMQLSIRNLYYIA